MYHKTTIERLSPAQISKLLNGHRVRVKHGHGHEVHLSSEQHKKLHNAHRKGAGITMELDPFQIQAHQHLRHASHAVRHPHHMGHMGHHMGHGEGWYDVAKSVGKAVAPALIDVGSNALKNYVEGHGEGLVRRRAVRRGRGEGLIQRKAPVRRGRGKKYHRGGALMPAGYGEGAVGSQIGSALGGIAGNFLPF
jgi:hypothetical protein